MCGLIKKDFLMIKQNLKVLMFILIIFSFITITNESNMIFMFPFMSVMISISTFSYDEFNKWNAYVITLPNGRKNVVRAKYISTLLFVIISFIVSIILLFIINKCGINIDLNSSILELTGCLFATFLIICIMFPVIFKYGAEKGRIVLFVIAFLISGIGLLITKNIHISIPNNIINFLENYYKILIPIITCLLIFISYKFSERIYLKKEL